MKILAYINSSNNNYCVFTLAFKAIHHMAGAYVSGVTSHHLRTHAPVQPHISLLPSPHVCSFLSVTSATPCPLCSLPAHHACYIHHGARLPVVEL